MTLRVPQRELMQQEKKCIQIIGQQLRKPEKIFLKQYNLTLEYCILHNGDPYTFQEIILPLTGFGSGWTGISMLGYELAKRSSQVCMLSMPGYGNSDDISLKQYSNDNLTADILSEFIFRKFPAHKIHLVGHSMASELIVRLACKFPGNIASLTLLNPAGFEKRGMLELGIKFLLNGLLHYREFRGNPYWEELKKYLPTEKSPFTFSRIPLRIKEWKRICSGKGYDYYKMLPKQLPLRIISGEKDFVFPLRNSAIVKSWKKTECLKNLWHNTTMYGSHETARAICDFLFSVK